MKYCYEDCARECQCGGEEHNCNLCGKRISDCEYVVNWGTCNKCFDEHLLEFPLGQDPDFGNYLDD